ncbi:MAG: hypothetical protein CM15mP32_5010 [Flavobacteriaceae bacterium]|nr:MAG: hypothetical protein CM15mP32_5010 [Flavobacteriaceae bacterium]
MDHFFEGVNDVLKWHKQHDDWRIVRKKYMISTTVTRMRKVKHQLVLFLH